MSDLAWMRPKLAELAGVTLHDGVSAPPGWSVGEPNTRSYVFYSWPWIPDEDVAQAVMSLDSAKAGRGCQHEFIIVRSSTQTTNHWECHLQYEDMTIVEKGRTLPHAICMALAAAFGWEAAA